MNIKFNEIWYEKYRPKSLNDLVLSKSNKTYLTNLTQDSNSIPHLLLTGSPGIGKTSLAKILVNDVLKTDYKYINASDESGIDTIREKVITYAQLQNCFEDKVKVVILDESDQISKPGQGALRNAIEEYQHLTRFILTANNKHGIIPALQSRCTSIDLTYTKKQYLNHLLSILKKEDIRLSNEILKQSLICFPDLRKGIDFLQKAYITGEQVVNTSEEFYREIINRCKTKDFKQLQSLREYIIDNENAFNGDYHYFLKQIYTVVYKYETKNITDALIMINDYMYRLEFVKDTEICAFSCLVSLSRLL